MHLIEYFTGGNATPRLPVVVRRAVVVAAVSVGLVPIAAAVEDIGAMQEVVVTATRREESVMKVPISVTALTEQAMELRGIKDFGDVARFTPGVTVSSGGGNTNAIAIRGISSSGGAGTTGIYIDDTPIQIRGIGFNPDDTLPKAFDLDRIEVLRGPQGTLFGAGSEGGTVRYILTQPSLSRTSTYARTEISSTAHGDPSYEVGIAHGGPIIEGELGWRANLWYRRDGGWVDRVDPFTLQTVEKRANHGETLLVRLAGIWRPVASLTITPSFIYQNRKLNDVDGYWPTLSDPGRGRFLSANPDRRPIPDAYYLPSLKVEWDLGTSELISNTSFYHRKEKGGYQGTLYDLGYYQTFNSPGSTPNAPYSLPFLDPAAYPLIDATGLHLPASLRNYRSPATVTNEQRNYTQEIRLQSTDAASRLTWTVGVFWSLDRVTSTEQINDPMIDTFFNTMFGVPSTDPKAFGLPLLPNGDNYYNQNIGYDRQLAGFGELAYKLTESLKATVGGRLSQTDFTSSHYADGPQNGGPAHGTGAASEKPFTPKFGLTWQIDSANMLYATYAKGFRVGGANAALPLGCGADLANLGLSGEPPVFKSDTVSSYELGAKNNIARRVQLASSVYYIKWSGIQQNVYLPGCGLQFTGNFGQATAKGFDLQADFELGGGVSLETAFGHTVAKFTANSPGNLVVEGDAVTGDAGAAPPWTAAIGAEYTFSVAGHESFVRLDWEYEQRTDLLTAAQDPNAKQYNRYSFTTPSTHFASLRAGVTLGGWNIALFVDNLFNATTLIGYNQSDLDKVNPNGSPAPLGYGYQTFRPRTVGLHAAYRQ